MSGFSGFTRLPRGFRLASTSALRFYVFAQSNPIWPQDGPKVAQDGSRWPQEFPSWGPVRAGAEKWLPIFTIHLSKISKHIKHSQAYKTLPGPWVLDTISLSIHICVYIYIYVYECVYVCMYIYMYNIWNAIFLRASFFLLSCYPVA